MGRSPTTDDDSCTGDDGSPSDRPLLYVMLTRSTLRLSPAEQPTSISPIAFAPTRRAASAMAGYSTAQRPVTSGRVRRRAAMATTESVMRSSVSIAAPAAASPSAAAKAAASAGARPARARSCSAARIRAGCRLRAGAASMARSASSDSLRATATRSYSGDVPAATTSPKRRYTSASVRTLPTLTAPVCGVHLGRRDVERPKRVIRNGAHGHEAKARPDPRVRIGRGQEVPRDEVPTPRCLGTTPGEAPDQPCGGYPGVSPEMTLAV